ncbi:transposase-like protein DUF772 [Palleronia aestuarii]|uniref:Transposase-like protein DUF772 n=1 Tax=Palleronia aestuarii TaxID=568105 RepID=A0A2W7PQL2_9RHOB|nr:transposase-like protein DUF772 [Palleronia aestuarii]
MTRWQASMQSSVRFERQLMEQLNCNLLVRWFVGLGIDDPACGEGRQP